MRLPNKSTALLFQLDGGSYLLSTTLFDYEVVLISRMLLNLEHQESFRFRSAFPIASFESSVGALKCEKGRFRLCIHEFLDDA